MRDDPVEIVVRKRYRVVWWDWKEHVPIDELSDAPKQGLVWMRMVLDTHCDQYGLIRSDPMSLDEAEEAWITGWERGVD